MRHHPYAVAFVICWLVAFAIVPGDGSGARLDGLVEHGFAALGAALILWALASAMIYVLRRA